MTDFFTSATTAGAKCGSVGSSSAWGVITTPGSLPITGATLSLSSGCKVTPRSSGSVDELAFSASSCGSTSVSLKGCRASITAWAVSISAGPACVASSV